MGCYELGSAGIYYESCAESSRTTRGCLSIAITSNWLYTLLPKSHSVPLGHRRRGFIDSSPLKTSIDIIMHRNNPHVFKYLVSTGEQTTASGITWRCIVYCCNVNCDVFASSSPTVVVKCYFFLCYIQLIARSLEFYCSVPSSSYL